MQASAPPSAVKEPALRDGAIEHTPLNVGMTQDTCIVLKLNPTITGS